VNGVLRLLDARGGRAAVGRDGASPEIEDAAARICSINCAAIVRCFFERFDASR